MKGKTMSGGSYDYASDKLSDLAAWVDTLERMAERCREWAVDPEAHRYTSQGTTPATLADRAQILLRAVLLDHAAKRLRRAVDEVCALEKIMHDVEWVASGDYSLEDLMNPVELTPND